MKNDTKMLIHVHLGENFYEDLNNEMENALEESSKKWGVHMNYMQKDNIFAHAQNQLKEKVISNVKHNWDMSNIVTVRVNSHKPGIEFLLPSEEANTSNIQLFYTREGWTIDQESQDDSILLKDFAEYMRNKILTWVNTAVFYGVGSYAQ